MAKKPPRVTTPQEPPSSTKSKFHIRVLYVLIFLLVVRLVYDSVVIFELEAEAQETRTRNFELIREKYQEWSVGFNKGFKTGQGSCYYHCKGT